MDILFGGFIHIRIYVYLHTRLNIHGVYTYIYIYALYVLIVHITCHAMYTRIDTINTTKNCRLQNMVKLHVFQSHLYPLEPGICRKDVHKLSSNCSPPSGPSLFERLTSKQTRWFSWVDILPVGPGNPVINGVFRHGVLPKMAENLHGKLEWHKPTYRGPISLHFELDPWPSL